MYKILEIEKDFFIPANNNEYIGLKNNLFSFNYDIWDCSKLVKNNLQGISKNKYIINFEKIKEDNIKQILKQFAWLLIAQDKVNIESIVIKINIHFISIIYKFFKLNKIKTFSTINNKTLNLYVQSFLKEKNYVPSFLANNVSIFIDICNTSYYHKWEDGTKSKIFLEESPYKYFNVKKYANELKEKDLSIPDNVFDEIIFEANKMNKFLLDNDGYILKTNIGFSKNISIPNLTRYAILIQAFTGLRISEVLTLKEDCLSIVNNAYWLTYRTSKTLKEPIYIKILISEIVYQEISDLIHITKDYRNILKDLNDNYSMAIKDYIFLKSTIIKNNSIITPKSESWTGQYLKPFIKKYNITFLDENGEEKLYPLKSHFFRHTFAKKLVNDNVPTRIIKRHYSHVSIDMTMRYINLKHEKVEKDYIKTFVDADTIYTNGKEGDLFKSIINNIKIEDNINDVINNLTKRFGINPLPMGLCILDYKKGHCTHTGSEGCYFSGCKDFVTNISFLDNFEKQRDLIIKEIDRTKNNKFAKLTFKINLKKKQKLDMIINSITNSLTYREGDNND